MLLGILLPLPSSWLERICVTKMGRKKRSHTLQPTMIKRAQSCQEGILSGLCRTVVNSNLLSCQNSSCGPSDVLTFWAPPPPSLCVLPTFLSSKVSHFEKHFLHTAKFTQQCSSNTSSTMPAICDVTKTTDKCSQQLPPFSVVSPKI